MAHGEPRGRWDHDVEGGGWIIRCNNHCNHSSYMFD